MENVKYSVLFVNNSTNSGSACLFQTDPDIGEPNTLSLAWLTKYTHPHTKVEFNWPIKFSFVWAETGELKPGIVFTASQVFDTDLKSNNAITLNYVNNAYLFEDQKQGDKPGTMYIEQTEAVPMKQASVGIGMAGSGTFVKQAQPNMNLKFTPHPRYWILFGNFTKGQVLSVEEMTKAAEIKFPTNVHSMTAILTKDNTWVIKPTKEINTLFLETEARDPEARWGQAA